MNKHENCEKFKIPVCDIQITLVVVTKSVEFLRFCCYLTLVCVFIFQIEVKLEDIENNNSQLGDLKQQLALLIQECEQLYSVYEERRNKV
jgi:hypothetical protein